LTHLIADHGGYAAEVDNREEVQQMFARVFRDWRDDRLQSSPLPPIGTAQAVNAILSRTRRLVK
jgi:hypothetical protein